MLTFTYLNTVNYIKHKLFNFINFIINYLIANKNVRTPNQKSRSFFQQNLVLKHQDCASLLPKICSNQIQSLLQHQNLREWKGCEARR